MNRRVTVDKNPAPYSDEIIAAFERMIPRLVEPGLVVHDPFAGDGVKLGALCDRIGYEFTGTDLEHWRVPGGRRDYRMITGDSTDEGTYPEAPFVVVTSPSYNNGVNDHFAPRETSRRLTYRVNAGRPLHVNNTGRYSGRGSKTAEAEYWRLTSGCVKHWPDLVLVNVKDSYREEKLYPFVSLWRKVLREHGYTVRRRSVKCPGWRYGENHAARVDVEAILIGTR
jgi:hypothetical protein